jgi:hypothetical protein
VAIQAPVKQALQILLPLQVGKRQQTMQTSLVFLA